MKSPILLAILDGFGETSSPYGNAILEARTPNLDRFRSEYPFATLGAAGLDVGLPEGQMGNSEVGHLNMGAGRVVYQAYTEIDQAIQNGALFENLAFITAFESARNKKSQVHFVGLLSDGGVHSHIRHFYALLSMAKKQGVERVFIHAVLDGRDVPPINHGKYMQALEKEMQSQGLGEIATVSGRYYAMDRDHRWERTQKAYEACTLGRGYLARSIEEAIELAYARKENDEFVQPTVLTTKDGEPKTQIRDGDSIIFLNFRPDRARQLTRAWIDPNFGEFQRERVPNVHFVSMTRYDETFSCPCAFPPHSLNNILGEVLSREDKKQLRIAETEKYAHVTYFFNGEDETPFSGEDRNLIPSPKEVSTYDQKPEMSLFEVEAELIRQIQRDYYDVIILNIANPDMVGHTGVYSATLTAISAVDESLGRIVEAIEEKNGIVLITADHGNAELMLDEQGNPITSHSINRVPFFFIGPKTLKSIQLREGGKLADIAPTLLQLLQIEIPKEMIGKSLILNEEILWKSSIGSSQP